MIGYPNGGSVHAEFAHSLIRLHRFELQNPADDYELMGPAHSSSLYVQCNRNSLVDVARSEGATWLLQLDGDESFQENLLRQLMTTAKNKGALIACGLYSNIGAPNNGSVEIIDCVYKMHENEQYYTVNPPDDMQPFRVDAAGAGVLLTHMSIYNDDDYPWFWLELFKEEGKRAKPMNEDIAFCKLMRSKGLAIWCDPRAEVTHWKTLPLSPSTMRQFLTKAQEAKKELSKGYFDASVR